MQSGAAVLKYPDETETLLAGEEAEREGHEYFDERMLLKVPKLISAIQHSFPAYTNIYASTHIKSWI